jgi:hypothetical protein
MRRGSNDNLPGVLTMPKKTFDQWMKEVDAELVRRCGMGYLDLPDVSYRQWWEDGVSVKGAASRAIKAAKE